MKFDLPEDDVARILYELFCSYYSMKDLSELFQLSQETVEKLIRSKCEPR